MLRRLSLWQRGDTIVEVMVVLTILGLALSISYATANRSLLNTRQAQEHAEATALAQAQLEKLRTYVSKPSSDTDHYIFLASGSNFCLDSAGKVATADADCTYQSLYLINESWNSTCTSASSSCTLTMTITWPDAIEGNDSVTLVYDLYPVS